MRRYRNTILISVLFSIALIFSSCVPRVQMFTVEVVSEPNPISVALLKDIEQADFEVSDLQKTPLVLNLRPEETVIVKVIDEEPSDEVDSIQLFDSWADGSIANPRVITGDSNKKLAVKTKTNVRVSVTTDPKNLVEIDGSGFYENGSLLTFVAPAEIGEYSFSKWKVNETTVLDRELSLKLEGPTKIEAVYELKSIITLKVETEPAGLSITVEGDEVSTPYITESESGTLYSLGFPLQEKDLSDLVAGADTRYGFERWSDFETDNPRLLTVESDLSLKVITETEYLVETSTFPEGVAEIPGSGWKVKGSSFSYESSDSVGYVFSHWEVNGERLDGNSISLIIDSPKSIIAHYEVIGYVLSVNTDPSGLEVKIGGEEKISPASVSATHGSSVSVEIPITQIRDESNFVSGGDARYTFSEWSDSITSNQVTILMDSDKSISANMEVEYLVETSTLPEGLNEITGAGWKPKGSLISYESSDLSDYTFSHWEVNGERVDGESLDLVVEKPVKIVAVYKSKEESALEIASNPEGLVFSLNNEAYSAPKSFVFESGTSVEVSFPASQEKDEDEQVSGNDTRFLFSKWADGATVNTRTVVVSEDTRLEAIASTEYLVQVSSETTQVEGSGWHKKGYSLILTAPEVSGYRFVSWTVNGTKAVGNPLSITVDSPKKIVAVYEEAVVSNKTLTVSSSPEALLVKIDGNQMVSPCQITAAEGSSHSISTITPQEKDISTQIVGNDVRYVFSGWNDGSALTIRTIELNSNLSFTAAFDEEFKLETAAQPSGIVQIGGAGWYPDGETVILNAVEAKGYNFLYWSVNGVKAGESSTIEFIVDKPTAIEAVYNSLPTISLEDREVSEGGVLELLLSEHSADVDGDTLSYSLLSGPGSISGGTYSVDTSELDAGTYEITIKVNDGRGGYATDGFTMTVTEQNNPPAVPGTPSPASGSVDQELSIELSWTCSDSDGDALLFDVYFGTSSSLEKVASDILANNWQSANLSEGVTYYWKIVAKDSKGATSESSVWSFSTKNSLPTDGVDKVGPVYSGEVLLVSNESDSGTSRAFTGTLSEDFLPTSFTHSDSLEMEAFMVNPEIPLPYDALPENIAVPGDTFELSSIGDTREFWVLNFATNKYYQLTATLQYSGQHSEVWVENTELITESKATEMGNEFDNVIYPLVTEYFYTPSDVDGNGCVQILCFDIQDNFATTGAYVGGYFSSGDLFNISGSNKSEIFYIDTYPTMYYPKDKPVDVSRAYSTLAHEFQHMVNFNRNYLVEGGDPMPSWINEGLSMAAEHLYSGVLTRRISYYNSSTNIQNGHSLVYWGDNNDTLSNYALSYLFLQYIRAQVGTESVYKDMLLDKNNNSAAITNAFAKYGIAKTLGEIMTDFRLALHLKTPEGPYGFMGDSDFDGIIERLYTGSSKELRGGSAIFKSISDSYTEPGDQGSTIQYAGITG